MNSDKIREIKEKYTSELMKKTNVVGVAIGYKEKGGQKTEIPSLVVMVRKRHRFLNSGNRMSCPRKSRGLSQTFGR